MAKSPGWILLADLEREHKEVGVVDAFADSLKYSLLQQPVLSLAQIADHVTGGNLKDKVTFMEQPKQAEFGTEQWHAQQLGSAFGTIAPFLLVHEGVSRFSTPASQVAMDAARLSQAERAVVGMSRIRTAAVSGAVYSGLFEPVAAGDDTSWSSFWSHKGKNMGVNALTFSALTAGSLGLNEAGIGLASRSRWASTILRNDITANAISGFAVGAGNAQAKSLLDGNGFASGADTLRTAYNFSMIGTALGITGRVAHDTMRPMDLEALLAKRVDKSAEPMRATDPKYLSDMIRPDGTREIVHLDGTRVTIAENGKATVEPSQARLARMEQPRETQPEGTQKVGKPSRWVEPREPDFSDLPPNERPLNVGSKSADQVSRDMSNFAETPFVLDGKRYASVEGFYVALKYSYDPIKADQAVDMVGAQAKRFGKGSSAKEATYEGETFKLGSPEHHAIIKRAIQAKLEQHPAIAREFMATHPRPIIHDLGYPEPPSNLPAKDFAKILTELRQDLVDGKIKLSDATTPSTTPPSRPISDFLAQLRGEKGGDHPIGRYVDAFANSDKRATSLIKVGGDSVVLQLDNGNVMHITNKILSPQLGTRFFDLPMVERGTVQSPGMDVHYFVQPKARTPVSEAAVRDFQTWIKQQGWMLSDGGQHQLGVHNGQTLLLDPFAVERIPFWKPSN